MKMLDGNSAAELNNDKFVSENEELAQGEARREFWRECYDRLLSGKTVHTFSRKFSLYDRMYEKYPDFEDLDNRNYNYIAAYHNNDLDPELRKLIEIECGALASLLVNELT